VCALPVVSQGSNLTPLAGISDEAVSEEAVASKVERQWTKHSKRNACLQLKTFFYAWLLFIHKVSKGPQ
jgi:hypothetical protein